MPIPRRRGRLDVRQGAEVERRRAARGAVHLHTRRPGVELGNQRHGHGARRGKALAVAGRGREEGVDPGHALSGCRVERRGQVALRREQLQQDEEEEPGATDDGCRQP